MKLRVVAVFVGLFGLALSAWAEPAASAAAAAAPLATPNVSKLKLASANALVFDAKADQPIYAKGADTVTPIASVTKLMTAMVVLDAGQPLDEAISIGIADIDLLKGSHSRLNLGSELSAQRDVAPRVDGFRESRGFESRAPLSGRDGGLRRGNEPQGARAGHDEHPFRRPDRTDEHERFDRQRSVAHGAGRCGI